jgi:hypothetical protein
MPHDSCDNRRFVTRKRKAISITPEIIVAFKRCDKISWDPLSIIPEEDGGRKREYLEAEQHLERLLGRGQPHQYEILQTLGDVEPPDFIIRAGPRWVQEWHEAAAIGRELERLAYDRS